MLMIDDNDDTKKISICFGLDLQRDSRWFTGYEKG